MALARELDAFGPGPLPPAEARERTAWRDGRASEGSRTLPAETPIALVHDASTTAVMMATPTDLEDFGIGFSLTERVVDDVSQITGIEVIEADEGLEVRMWLTGDRTAELAARRRRMAGPTGCGLCGVDSLAEAARTPRPVTEALTMSFAEVQAAVEALSEHQALGRATRAVHAAGFWTPRLGMAAVREDVGRHNALDKLAGALVRGGIKGPGAVVLTSRVSVEMVQKTAAVGAPILIAVSAPTTLAVQTAQAAGVTLCAIARGDGFEVFTYPERIV